jgi:hypothetical protein
MDARGRDGHLDLVTGRFRTFFAGFFGRSRRDQFLEQYVLREHARGRRLEEILEDPYLRNRTTEAERARLLDRPEIVAAVRRQTAAPGA